MIAGIRQAQVFSFDEYRTMLGLQCGVDPTQGEAGAQEATDRGYSGYMIDLAGLELENTSS
jgi:exocyst complex component 4